MISQKSFKLINNESINNESINISDINKIICYIKYIERYINEYINILFKLCSNPFEDIQKEILLRENNDEKNNDEKNSLNSLNNLYLKSPTKYNIFTGLNIHLNMNIEENYKLLVKCMLNTIIYKESNDDRKHTIKTLIPLVMILLKLVQIN